MKPLKDIVYNVTLKTVSGDMNTAIGSICFDSRASEQNCLFVAVKGTQVDGHKYIDRAIELGAVAVVCQELPEVLGDNVTYVVVEDSAEALGRVSSNFYGNPSKKLQLIGITGTNGKTSVVTLLYKVFRQLGYNTGLMSTVSNYINDKEVKASHTTPDAVQINKLIYEMASAGCTHVFMEVSSHAIDQRRIAGLHFAGAVFMNISHDHLDYHKTFESYIKTKKQLFDDLPKTAFALVNLDDKRGQFMLQNTKATNNTFGLKFLTDFKARIMTNSLQGLEVEIDGREAWFQLIGKFNAYNILAVYSVGVLLGEDNDELLLRLSNVTTAPGRFERVDDGTSIIAIVDYAHTPDALENVLQTIGGFRTGNEQVITLVGCGGNRDKEKRPVMASIAVKWSDKVIFTDDNPRDENPSDIVQQMQDGVSKAYSRKTLVIQDRREAIKTACSMASPGDILLVAGKGHENYQEIKGVRHHFDDREVVREMLELFKN